MFSRIMRMPVTRLVAMMVLVAFTLTITYVKNPVRADAATTRNVKITLAAIGIENLTKYELLSDDHGIDMLLAEISAMEGVNIVPQNKVMQSLEGHEPNPDVAISVGKSVGAEAVMVGFVSNLHFDGTEQASVEVGLSIYNTEDGRLLSEAVVVGRSSRLGFSGSLEELAELAVRDGIRTGTGFVFQNLTTFGVVTLLKGDRVFCNLAEKDNVRSGAEIAIFQKSTNRQIATIEVEDVSIAHSMGKIIEHHAGVPVAVGDNVRLIYTPVVIEITGGQKKMPKKKKFSPLILGALAVGVIAAVSRGGNKAEPPNPTSGSASKASSDGKAVVYSESGWQPNYVPAAPVKIDPADISKTDLQSCMDSDTFIVPLEETAYNFTLSTTPKSKNIPGAGYTIAFDLENLYGVSGGYTAADTANLSCATCNTDLGEWEVLSGTYSKMSYLSGNYGVSCVASHFTPYIVVIDNRINPLPAPTTYLDCGDQKAMLGWDAISDENNIGYVIWNCNQSTCNSIKATITDISQTSVDYTVSNNAEVCYAVSGKSSVAGQDALRSEIKCTTPSSDPEACQQHAITLVEPPNNSTVSITQPMFTFIGAGDMDFYILQVSDVVTNTILYSTNIAGEGATSEDGRKQFQATYGGEESLVTGSEYKWKVTGYQNIGSSLVSSPYKFIYEPTDGGTAEETCIVDEVPDPLSPTSGSFLTTDAPSFRWKAVAGATEYRVTVYDNAGTIVSSIADTSSTKTNYSGAELVDEADYQWFVTAYDDCNNQVSGSVFSFTKMPPDNPSTLPPPTWVDTNPILSGDQWVALNWNRVDDPLVVGYAIYRTDTAASVNSMTLINVIYESNMTQSNSACGISFSENNPGYCDESVANGETYYYRVAAIQQGETAGKKSEYISTQLELQRPELIFPGDVVAEELTTSDATFLWFPINGKNITYIMTVYDDSNGVVLYNWTTTNTYHAYGGPLFENGKTYRWSVRAFNTVGVQSEQSQVYRFIKVDGGTAPDKVEFCGIIATTCPKTPDAYSINYSRDSITVNWAISSSENISHYIIYRCQDTPGICNTSVGTTGNVACSTSQSDTVCFEDTGLERGSTYYYNVVAVDKSGQESEVSDTLSAIMTLKGPSLLYPAYGQYVYDSNPTFSWITESGVDNYIFQIQKSPPDTMTAPENYIWSAVIPGTGGAGGQTQSVIFDNDMTAKEGLQNPSNPSNVNQVYMWRVCSINERNYTTPVCPNPTKFFKLLKSPKVTVPESDQYFSVAEVNFQWNQVSDAAGYSVRVCKLSGTTNDKCYSTLGTLPIVYEADQGGTSLSLDVSQFDRCELGDPLCGGRYRLEVRAYDANNYVSSDWQYANGVTFTLVFGETPQLISPADEQIIGPDTDCVLSSSVYGEDTYGYNIDFSWIDIGGPYMFKLVDIDASGDAVGGSSGEVIILEKSLSSGQLQIGGCGGDNTIGLMAGHKYQWNVTVYGTPYDDSTAKTFYTGLPYPHLVAPGHGEQVLLKDDCDQLSSTLCIHFDWDGGSTTKSGETIVLPGVIGALSYDVEIRKNGTLPFLCENFKVTDPIDPDAPYKNTTNTFCDLTTDGTSAVHGDVFTWRVRARDASGLVTQSGSGLPGPWSQWRQFTVSIPPVVLAVPPYSGECDPYVGDCTNVVCQDTYFAWSPIPAAFGTSCYRIDVSDTTDFRNLVWTDNTNSPINSFPCDLQQCYQAGSAAGQFIPMTNGVVYYWRVGSSVTPSSGGSCGFTWVYSDTWEFFKKPPGPQSVTAVAGQYDLTINWTQPVNCTSSTGQALSLPAVPADSGEYLVYLDSSGSGALAEDAVPLMIVGPSSTGVQIVSLSCDTPYSVCVRVADGSYYIDHPGHYSQETCVTATTLACPEN